MQRDHADKTVIAVPGYRNNSCMAYLHDSGVKYALEARQCKRRSRAIRRNWRTHGSTSWISTHGETKSPRHEVRHSTRETRQGRSCSPEASVRRRQVDGSLCRDEHRMLRQYRRSHGSIQLRARLEADASLSSWSVYASTL